MVAIHQPNFLPWLGYFRKLALVDAFVFLDNAQYTKNSFINRNRIKTQAGIQWLTVPVLTRGRFLQAIHQVVTASETDWRRKHLQAMQVNYGRAAHFEEVFALLEPHYLTAEAQTNLADFNILLIRTVCSYLGLTPRLIRARDLAVSGNSTDLLVSICRELKANAYLAGRGAVKYQEDEHFKSAGIRVEYENFVAQPYDQLWGSFSENLSILDALMNCGQGTRSSLADDASTTPPSIADNYDY